jgi:hypothetical protein
MRRQAMRQGGVGGRAGGMLVGLKCPNNYRKPQGAAMCCSLTSGT